MSFSTHTLTNGLRVCHYNMPSLNSITVLAMVKVGSRDEAAKVAGVSHFLEHMPFKGTEKYPTPLALAEAIDGVGGAHNAFTSKEYTGYWVKLSADKLDLALDIISDMLLVPALKEADINQERGVIIEEINMYEDRPQSQVGNLYDSLVYNGTSLAGDVIGTKETVSNLNHADFLDHYDSWYNLENVVLGLAGKLPEDMAKLEEKINNYFSKGSKRSGKGKRTSSHFSLDSQRVQVITKDTEQAHFVMGVPSISRHDEDRYAQAIMTTILGGNSSSWLFNEVREKRGLAYYAYAGNDIYEDIGSLYAFEGVAINNVDEAIKVTLDQFQKLLSPTSISEEMLHRAKEYIVGKTTLDMEDSSRMANYVVRKALFYGEVETIEEHLAKLKAVTLDDIQRVAQRVLDFSKLNLAVIGPFKDQEKFEKLIKA